MEQNNEQGIPLPAGDHGLVPPEGTRSPSLPADEDKNPPRVEPQETAEPLVAPEIVPPPGVRVYPRIPPAKPPGPENK